MEQAVVQWAKAGEICVLRCLPVLELEKSVNVYWFCVEAAALAGRAETCQFFAQMSFDFFGTTVFTVACEENASLNFHDNLSKLILKVCCGIAEESRNFVRVDALLLNTKIGDGVGCTSIHRRRTNEHADQVATIQNLIHARNSHCTRRRIARENGKLQAFRTRTMNHILSLSWCCLGCGLTNAVVKLPHNWRSKYSYTQVLVAGEQTIGNTKENWGSFPVLSSKQWLPSFTNLVSALMQF